MIGKTGAMLGSFGMAAKSYLMGEISDVMREEMRLVKYSENSDLSHKKPLLAGVTGFFKEKIPNSLPGLGWLKEKIWNNAPDVKGHLFEGAKYALKSAADRPQEWAKAFAGGVVVRKLQDYVKPVAAVLVVGGSVWIAAGLMTFTKGRAKKQFGFLK